MYMDESPQLNKYARRPVKANSAGKIFESEICIKNVEKRIQSLAK